MTKALKSNKGNGYAARLLDLCDVAELPVSITGFLDRIYADFPKPEPAPLPPEKIDPANNAAEADSQAAVQPIPAA